MLTYTTLFPRRPDVIRRLYVMSVKKQRLLGYFLEIPLGNKLHWKRKTILELFEFLFSDFLLKTLRHQNILKIYFRN